MDPMVNVLNFVHSIEFIPYFFGLHFAFLKIFNKILSGMTNSVNSVQIASKGTV